MDIRQASLELQRLLVQKAMQDKANTVEEKCPDCGARLTDKKRRVSRWIDAYCGKVKLVRIVHWRNRWQFQAVFWGHRPGQHRLGDLRS